ncbi:MAG: cysteine desulfurase [Myxococcales bacterium]|nr:cysteine desulfurase [Myxococcales bacterium]
MTAAPRATRIYLDHNAGAPLLPAARAAMLAALEHGGNPSSLHEEGRQARQVIERARNQVAGLLGAPREEVIFTSGGTEADQLGILGLAQRAERQGRPRRVATSGLEHPAVQGAVRYLVRALRWERVELAVDAHGRLQLPDRPEALGLVAVGWVNHELGVQQDLAEVAAFARRAGALGFVDAVQAAGKLALGPLTAATGPLAGGLDGVAISSHKLGGPKGAGALWLRSDAAEALPLVEGGHQERGRRPGTENPVALAGFGAAAAAVDLSTWPQVLARAAELEDGLRAQGARVHGALAPRLPSTVNVAFDGAPGESIVMALDLVGVAASTGAACSSGSVQPSPVLLALGLPPAAAREAVRFSLGPGVTAQDVQTVLSLLPDIVARVRRFA